MDSKISSFVFLYFNKIHKKYELFPCTIDVDEFIRLSDNTHRTCILSLWTLNPTLVCRRTYEILGESGNDGCCNAESREEAVEILKGVAEEADRILYMKYDKCGSVVDYDFTQYKPAKLSNNFPTFNDVVMSDHSMKTNDIDDDIGPRRTNKKRGRYFNDDIDDSQKLRSKISKTKEIDENHKFEEQLMKQHEYKSPFIQNSINIIDSSKTKHETFQFPIPSHLQKNEYVNYNNYDYYNYQPHQQLSGNQRHDAMDMD